MVCTNKDPNISLGTRKFPGTGCLVDAIQITLNTEKGSQLMTKPIVAGMPNPYAVDVIMQEHSIEDKS